MFKAGTIIHKYKGVYTTKEREWGEREGERETDRQTDGQTDRSTYSHSYFINCENMTLAKF